MTRKRPRKPATILRQVGFYAECVPVATHLFRLPSGKWAGMCRANFRALLAELRAALKAKPGSLDPRPPGL